MPTTPARLAAVLATAVVLDAAAAVPIPVYGTGIGLDGSKLPDGEVDPHYTVTRRLGQFGFPTPKADTYVVANRPAGWRPNPGGAKWISHHPDQGLNPPVCPPAGSTYRYSTAFDLSGLDPATAVLDIAWSADNIGVTILLNGVGSGGSAPGFVEIARSTLSQGFVPGLNTLEFDVFDVECPTGLVVEIVGTAEFMPGITFGVLPERRVGAPPSGLYAFASTPGAIVFSSSTPAVCTAAGSTVTVLAEGTCTIVASQPGGLATPVQRSFAVRSWGVDPGDVERLASGDSHDCFVMADGVTRCRGDNYYGQTGGGTGPSPAPVPGLPANVTALTATETHTCALLPGGEVLCWGALPYFEYPPAPPSPVPGLGGGITAIAAGGFSTCAVTASGGVKCWNRFQLSAQDVAGLASGVKSVAVGLGHACALTASGSVKCWGSNSFGQLGNGTTNDGSISPVADVSGLEGVVAISAGSAHTCALVASGDVKCWGANASGQLGDGSFTARLAPVSVAGLNGRAVAIATIGSGIDQNGFFYPDGGTCAVLDSGSVRCWGSAQDPVFAVPAVPRDVPGIDAPVVAISGAKTLFGGRFCMLTAIGGVDCRGEDANAKLPGIDSYPAAMTFASRPKVALASVQVSDAITPAGFYDPAPVTVSQGEYSIGCTATFTSAAGTLLPGQSVCVRHTASTLYNTTVTTTLTVGSTAATFATTTGGKPVLGASAERLSFGSVAVGQASIAQLLTVSNTGDNDAQGLGWGVDGNFVAKPATCGATLASGASCTLSVSFTPQSPGALADELLIFVENASGVVRVALVGTGTASDTTPDPFTFVDQFLVPVNTVVTSAPVRIKGLENPTTISVAGGSYAISKSDKCDGDVRPFGVAPATVADGEYVCVRHTSSAVSGGSNDTTLFVGGLADVFTSVTVDTEPTGFSLGLQLNVPPNTMRTSAAAVITGINAPTPFSASGGEVSVNCTGAFAASGTLAPGSTICARHMAAASYNQSRTTTVSVGGVSADFVSTTFDAFGDADNDGIPNAMEFNEARNPEAKDNDVFGNARLFAMQQYRDFLGREGDAGGIDFFVNLLTSGAAVRANVIESFFFSPEFSDSVSPITRLYFATFLRVPDYEGLIFQANAFRAGTPLDVIANNFTLSPEFQSRYGALSNPAYVALLYQNILGRTASQGEIDFHVARLVSGVTRGAVLVGFSESPEFKQNAANDVYVTMMYVGMLRRAPEPAGFDYWVDYMEAGNPGINLILGFLNAPEYRQRFMP